MNDFSILIAGKAGDGIDRSGLIIARILNRLNYRIYIYREYPSLIRGGHTFSIIRASNKRIAAHTDRIDFLLALNQDAVQFHKERLKPDGVLIYNSDLVKAEILPHGEKIAGIPLERIAKEEKALDIMRNSCITGALAKAAGIEWNILEAVFRKYLAKELDLNLKVAKRGYDEVRELAKVETLKTERMPILTGSEAIGLGLIKGGLNTYVAYPMTPSSPLLHFLAGVAEGYSLKVIHPESEIAVILMALGFSYMGERVAVGTSGGGFCLMTEGLSFAGMAELPVVIMVGERPGPSTGLPTYSSQTELNFVLNAGHGEFPRFVVAPGDAEEAFYWSHVALNITWKYQIPSFILSDKTLAEGAYSFDSNCIGELKIETSPAWDRKGEYKRYLNTETGVSPLTFVPDKDAVIKVNSYEHDELGITAEDAKTTVMMQEKRLRKERFLANELEDYDAVKSYGDKNSKTALLCWGSNKGVSVEAAENLGLKAVQVIALSPFPTRKLENALKGARKIIVVENNATGQLARLLNYHGLKTDENILKYDGRPFSVDELKKRLKGLG